METFVPDQAKMESQKLGQKKAREKNVFDILGTLSLYQLRKMGIRLFFILIPFDAWTWSRTPPSSPTRFLDRCCVMEINDIFALVGQHIPESREGGEEKYNAKLKYKQKNLKNK